MKGSIRVWFFGGGGSSIQDPIDILVLFAAHTLYSKCECEYADFDVPVFAH